MSFLAADKKQILRLRACGTSLRRTNLVVVDGSGLAPFADLNAGVIARCDLL